MLELGRERSVNPQTQCPVGADLARHCMPERLGGDNGRPIVQHARGREAALAINFLRHFVQGGGHGTRRACHGHTRRVMGIL